MAVISSIEDIPEITVSGIDLPVYSFDWTFGGGSAASRISISFINESGEYTPPELSTITATTITVGAYYVFNYYPVKYTINRSTSGGRTMTVEYVDKSIILDRTFVGLQNTHRDNKKTGESDGPLLIVGKALDPCRSILDGELIDDSVDGVADPCNPCTVDGSANGDLQERLIDCAEERRLKVLDFEYTFKELLEALDKADGITVVDESEWPETNDDYKSHYTGTLRSVLSSWCSDYGFTFYWGEGLHNGSLKDDVLLIKDVRTGIEIDDGMMLGCDTTVSETESKSLEGTVGKGIVGYFHRDGAQRDYECEAEWCKKINMRPLNLDHILENPKPYESWEELETMCALSYYSPKVRDFVSWFKILGITEADELRLLVGGVIHPDDQPKLFGFKTITTVLDTQDGADERVAMPILAGFFGEGSEELEDLRKRRAYIFQAERDLAIHEKQISKEQMLANDFLGQYYVRKLTQNMSGLDYSYLTPDGDSLTYYRRNDPLQLPFAQFLWEDKKTLADYLGTLIDPATEEASDHFLLLKRNPEWSPLRESVETDALMEFVDKFGFVELGASNFETADGSIGPKPGHSWFMAFPLGEGDPEDLTTTYTSADNPGDLSRVDLAVDACNLGTTYGLRDASCKLLTLKQSGFETKIFLPTHAHVDALPGEEEEVDHAGYDILWDKSGGLKTFIEQPKIELVERLLPDPDNPETQFMSVDINTRDMTQDVIDLYSSDRRNELENLCKPKEETIRQRMRELIDGMEFVSDAPFETRSYVVAGLPPLDQASKQPPKIGQGLQSMSVRIGSDGLETHLSFGNSQRKPIPPNVFVQQYETWHRKRYYRNYAALQAISAQPEEFPTF